MQQDLKKYQENQAANKDTKNQQADGKEQNDSNKTKDGKPRKGSCAISKRDGGRDACEDGNNLNEKEPEETKPDGIEPEQIKPTKETKNTIEKPEQIPKEPEKILHENLAKGLGYLQAAQFMTDIVDSATAHLNGSITGKVEEDIKNGNFSDALKSSGKVLLDIADDTIPGLNDIRIQTEELERKLQSIQGKSTLDTVIQALEAVVEHQAKVELTILKNYVPGVPEVLKNFNEELQEASNFKGTETGVQKAERIAGLITKGVTNTVNDIFRDWVPAYKEIQDSAREKWKGLGKEVIARGVEQQQA
ncbi:hypothetical protein HRG_006127 [Hirsutella rhossiliensis]|uniref:Uncharacterized protein n=1 Tax=Hirsutella rhossiliensis TaxID=111463 RepID=A0A9P8MYF3_9HYPO|nr:uncharacterized protein HRG_06127 [Hirsutella rhossiliensis]KAH0963617.1 hypothetical protein HRG_06127 [Hirsutella rhossiliensis]